MNEVYPGVYRMKLPLPTNTFLGYVNVYLLKGDEGYLLVDTGWSTEEAYTALTTQLAEIGAEVTQISKIIITHIHPDHYGQAGRIKQMSNATVYFHYLEKDLVEQRYSNMEPLLKQTAEWLKINGVPPDQAPLLQQASVEMARKFVRAIPPDVELWGGEMISHGDYKLKVIWTPGHSKGQVCLHDARNKVLYTGDHILPNITPNVGLHPQSTANPIGDFITSLQELRNLDVDLILPAHENPFTGLKERIDKIIAHHEERKAHIIGELRKGTRTAYQVAEYVPWLTDYGGISFAKLSPSDKRLAVLETLAHLEVLRVSGKVVRFMRNGTAFFQPA